MNDARYQEITQLAEPCRTLPPDKFVARMNDLGVDNDELIAYAKRKEKIERAANVARRR